MIDYRYIGKKLRSLFDKRKFFLKTLVTFAVSLTLGMGIISILLFQTIKAPLQNAISKTQQTFLSQIRSSTDAYVLNQINSLLIQNIMDFRQYKELNYFFALESSEQRDIDELYLVYQMLSVLKTHNNFLHSIVIYNPYAKVIISSDQGVTFTDGRGNDFSKTHFNLKAAEDFINSNESSRWVTAKENELYLNNLSMVSYISSVPIMRTAEHFYGCIILNLDMSTLTNYIDNSHDADESSYFIINENGIVMASSDYEVKKDVDYSWINELAANNNEGISIHNSQSAIWAKSEFNDWVYAASLPTEQIYREIGVVSQRTIAITIAVTVLTVFFIYWAIKWLQRPILKLVARNARMGAAGDEIKDIDGIINHFSVRIVELENTLTENEKLIKNQLILDILNGNISGMEEIKSRFSIIGDDFNYRYFTLIFTQINSESIKNIDYRNKEYLFLKVSGQLEAYWEKFGSYFSIRHNGFIISILAHYDKWYEYKIVPRDIDIGATINIGICETVDNIMELHFQFEKLESYMQYQFIYDYGNVFTYKDIEDYEKSSAEIPDNFFKNVEDMLKAGKTDDLKCIIKDTLDLIKKDGFSYEYTQSALLQIVNLLCKVVREQKLINDSLSKSKLVAEFYNAKSLHDFENWIDALLNIYQEEFDKRNKTVQNTFIIGIADYIAENITENISLKSVATKFAISEGHLSRAFKDALNINFSAYLAAKKFEAAAEMLAKHGAVTVTEIAEKLGYYNMQYFNRQFKEKYGVLPSQYRKLHLGKESQ